MGNERPKYLDDYPFRPGYPVAVVGMGAVTPLGLNVETTWEGLLEGRCGISKLEGLLQKVGCQVGGVIRGFDEEEILRTLVDDPTGPEGKAAGRAERASMLALAAVREAVTQCNLPTELYPSTGVLIGSNIAGIEKMAAAQEKYREGKPRQVSALLSVQGMPNATNGVVSIVDGFKGGGFAPASACATGAQAIGEGFLWVNDGKAPVVVAGGCESSFAGFLLASFSNLGALTTRNDDPLRASRPFDDDRDGFVPSEAAGVVVLMNAHLAQRLGIPILAQIVGYGTSYDGRAMTDPTKVGMAAAMNDALRIANEVAGVKVGDIDHLNAHATSTDIGDGIEGDAIEDVLGDHVGNVPVCSNKGNFGHQMGAAGAVETIIAIKTLETGIVPATLNLEHPDSESRLNHVIADPREHDVRTVLKNSFGFGGTNACLVIQRRGGG